MLTDKALPRLLAFIVAFSHATTGYAASPEKSGDASSSSASGSPGSDSGQERVAGLYESAKTLYDEGQYEAAASAFRAAYDIAPEPNLLFNIYVCYDRIGELDLALDYLNKYSAEAPASEQADLERRRNSLVARIDRQQRAQNRDTSTDNGDSTDFDADSDSGLTKEPGDTDPTDRRERVFGPAAWVLTGVTAVALGLGIGLGVSSLRRTNAAEEHCAEFSGGTVCGNEASSDLNTARNHGIGADVSFGIAGAAAIALVTVVAVKVAKRRKREAAANLVPSVGPSSAGLVFGGRF